MTTEKTLDQMMELLPHVSTLLADPELQKLGCQMRPGKDGAPAEIDSLAAMNRVFPLMLTAHRAELYGILGVLLDKTAEEVKQLPFEEVRGVLKADGMRAFFDFFPFLLQMAIRA